MLFWLRLFQLTLGLLGYYAIVNQGRSVCVWIKLRFNTSCFIDQEVNFSLSLQNRKIFSKKEKKKNKVTTPPDLYINLRDFSWNVLIIPVRHNEGEENWSWEGSCTLLRHCWLLLLLWHCHLKNFLNLFIPLYSQWCWPNARISSTASSLTDPCL